MMAGDQKHGGLPRVIECIEGACKSEYQDALYGKGKRIHNETGNPSEAGGDYRCTVCGRVR